MRPKSLKAAAAATLSTPAKHTVVTAGNHLRDFVRQDFPGQRLTWVSYRPEPDALPDYRFRTVATVVDERGGVVILGWGFGIHDGFLVAVHHAIWEDPSGHLVDVSPADLSPTDDQGRVPFVVDPSATLLKRLGDSMGIPRPSRFWLTSSNRKTARLVAQLIAQEREYERVFDNGGIFPVDQITTF